MTTKQKTGFGFEASHFKMGRQPLRFGLKPGMRVPSTGRNFAMLISDDLQASGTICTDLQNKTQL